MFAQRDSLSWRTFAQNRPYTLTDERYEHRHDWRKGLNGHTRLSSLSNASTNQVVWGELRFVMGGATAVNGSGGAAGFLRNLDRSSLSGVGVPIALASDWIISGSMNMLRELQCADGLNRNFFGGFFTDEALWIMATRDAAAALAVDDSIGTLAPGRVADISVFNASTHRDHRAVIDAHASDVVLVLRGGTAMYGDADVVGALPGGDTCETLDVCGSPKRVCISREVSGLNLSRLRSANTSAYPLFFCVDPPAEPSCLPARNAMAPLPNPVVDGSTRYAGVSDPNDTDGDGIPNASDNCPTVFNPVRPVDGGRQADSDMDGLGDSCDPRPLNAATMSEWTMPNSSRSTMAQALPWICRTTQSSS